METVPQLPQISHQVADMTGDGVNDIIVWQGGTVDIVSMVPGRPGLLTDVVYHPGGPLATNNGGAPPGRVQLTSRTLHPGKS